MQKLGCSRKHNFGTYVKYAFSTNKCILFHSVIAIALYNVEGKLLINRGEVDAEPK